MIKANHRKGRWGWGTLLVVLVTTGVAFKLRNGNTHGFSYQLTKVTRGSVRSTILSTGTVAPVNRIDLKSPVAGRVEKVIVREGQRVRPGQILAWMSSTERAALIDTARAKGPEEVKYWEDAYKMTPILAPGRGLIILKNADAGQSVTQSDIILSMSDRLMVKANVDETDLAEVREGQRVSLVLDAFPNEPLPAKVFHVGYDARTVNNVTTYEVDVIADKTPSYMKSGMTANVTFLVSEKENALLVSAAAIHRGEKTAFVMVPDPQDPEEALEKEVKIGISDGKRVEILAGLEEGQTIRTAAVRSLAREEKTSGSPLSPFGSRPGTGKK